MSELSKMLHLTDEQKENLVKRARGEDPTAVDMDTDPYAQRFKGYALHGNTPFDVPFISEIDHNLFQGGCRNGLVLPKGIKTVLSLYPWEKYAMSEDVNYIEIKMYDSTTQGFEGVHEAADLVNEFRKSGPVLVHCQAGLNRSSLIAATAPLMHEGLTAKDAIAHIRKQRSPACLCNPSFERWLLSQDPFVHQWYREQESNSMTHMMSRYLDDD